MNKIEEIRRLLAERTFTEKGSHTALTGAFYAVFDAAIELELPVLFLQWQTDNKYVYYPDKNKYVAAWDNYAEYTAKELYDYWIENIYKL